MRDVRVVVGKFPLLLGEIILAALTHEEGVRVVGEADNEDVLVDLATREQPDVVVLGSVSADAQTIGHRLLDCCPFVKVVALTSNGRTTFLFELRPQKIELGELSPSELGRVVTRLMRPPVGASA
jgi:DNA-binding NarL/FixJ family response regulator